MIAAVLHSLFFFLREDRGFSLTLAKIAFRSAQSSIYGVAHVIEFGTLFFWNRDNLMVFIWEEQCFENTSKMSRPISSCFQKGGLFRLDITNR